MAEKKIANNFFRHVRRGRDWLTYRGAFSLAELSVVVLVTSLIFAACTSLFLAGTNFWQTDTVKVTLTQELRKAESWIVQDLQQAGSSESILNSSVPADGTTYTSITFRKAGGVNNGIITWAPQTIQYLLAGGGSSQLQRQSGLQNKIIAQYMQTLQFRRQATAPDILEVSLGVQKSTLQGSVMNSSLNFKIQLRN
ncbi:MAG: hypothetical protein ABIJ41_00665 [Candidatus Omnitrophota bacterium]